MKIITCASYYSSGSSAVSDLVAEYGGVKNMSDYEFRFLHDPDGVSDLEFQLVECHNRHNSGHALKRFMRLSEFNHGKWFNKRYEPFFGGHYLEYTKEYVNALTDFTYKGWWFYDLYDKGVFRYYLTQTVNHAVAKLNLKRKDVMGKTRTLCSHPGEEKFLDCTREYVGKLMRAANPEGAEYLEIDQLVPSQNINRILRYIGDEIFVFVVDRDPRDVYTQLKCFSKERVCPVEVDEFCNWFNYTRESGSAETTDPSKVMHLHFEDLIYRYDETVAAIENFVGLDPARHERPFTGLNPRRSVVNTRIWERPGLKTDDDIKIIEQRCAKYLYDFESVKNNEIAGVAPDSDKVF